MNPVMHDGSGKFKAGNPGGPGNPDIKKLASYKKALSEAVSKKDFKEVINKLLALAKGGDIQAIKVLLDRCLGKAPQNINLNQIGLQPVTIEFKDVGVENEKKE